MSQHPSSGGVRVQLHQLSKRFGQREVLKRNELTIEPGEFVAIVGRSRTGPAGTQTRLWRYRDPAGAALAAGQSVC